MNSDFSQNPEESTPYRDSSDFSSESFIVEMSGSGGAMLGSIFYIAGGEKSMVELTECELINQDQYLLSCLGDAGRRLECLSQMMYN